MSRVAVPWSTLASLALIPTDGRVALLIRHSHRLGIPSGEVGKDVGLSARGVRMAEALGGQLSAFTPGRLMSSPVPRAADTARGIARGAGWKSPVREDWRLGDPGPFVVDSAAAGPCFVELGAEEVVRRQISGYAALPGMRPTSEGVRLVLELAGESLGGDPGLDVLATHDVILAVVVNALLGVEVEGDYWPDFLEGLFLWGASGGGFAAAWRGAKIRVGELGGLNWGAR